MKKLFCVCALVLGATAFGSISSLQAAYCRTAKVNIPYQFRVSNVVMPGGEYRLMQEVGSEIATLINVNTGKRVQLLRPSTAQVPGKAFFKLVREKDGFHLKIS
jgi:hypothetical protein